MGRGVGHAGRRRRLATSAVLALSVATILSATVALDAGPARAGTPVPGAAGCPMFPSDNICLVRADSAQPVIPII
jgi:hypothetical protein